MRHRHNSIANRCTLCGATGLDIFKGRADPQFCNEPPPAKLTVAAWKPVVQWPGKLVTVARHDTLPNHRPEVLFVPEPLYTRQDCVFYGVRFFEFTDDGWLEVDR